MSEYFVLSFIPFILYVVLKTKKSFQMLQQNWYNLDQRYLKWIFKNPWKVFIEIDMFFIVFVVMLAMDMISAMILFGVFYLVTSFLYYQSNKKEQVKLKLAFTKRVRRLSVTTMILYLIPLFSICFMFDVNYIAYYYFIMGALAYLNYFVVLVANTINLPIEHQVFLHYKRKATRKLSSMSQLDVIGITGSYGKTSSKNILSDILNVKYNAFATPKNFNTTYGMIRAINESLDKFNDLFIAEMGAFKQGEIKELCDFVHPKYGILTRIGTAHLESFGSQSNIQKGKFELIESLPEDGVGILNKDDALQVSYHLKNKCHIIWIGIEQRDADLYAENIHLSEHGTSFDIVWKKENIRATFQTRLLGKNNVYNILAAVALGKYLGMTIDQLVTGVKQIRPIEHRLELKPFGNVTLIEDDYNANPIGAKEAIEVLAMMPGKKIIITPGMIELGPKQYELNLEFGKQIGESSIDEVILIGKEQTRPIQDGLKVVDYNEKHVHILNDVKLAFPLIQKLSGGKKAYALIENDLPDTFNEKTK